MLRELEKHSYNQAEEIANMKTCNLKILNPKHKKEKIMKKQTETKEFMEYYQMDHKCTREPRKEERGVEGLFEEIMTPNFQI